MWPFGVARRVLANQRRTAARHDRLRHRLTAVPDHHDEPDPQRDELRAALAELSDDDRAVVTMRCWDGLAVGEMATLLDCTPNAVSIRVHRARRQIADRLTTSGTEQAHGHP